MQGETYVNVEDVVPGDVCSDTEVREIIASLRRRGFYADPQAWLLPANWVTYVAGENFCVLFAHGTADAGPLKRIYDIHIINEEVREI